MKKLSDDVILKSFEALNATMLRHHVWLLTIREIIIENELISEVDFDKLIMQKAKETLKEVNKTMNTDELEDIEDISKYGTFGMGGDA